MSKAEKRSFSQTSSNTDYYDLYRIIEANTDEDIEKIKQQYRKIKPKANFNVNSNYLYSKILDSLLALEVNNNVELELKNDLTKAEILTKKSLFKEALDIYSSVQEKANKIKNSTLFMMAAQAELELLLQLNFPEISEQELLHKHFLVSEAIKHIRKENELSVLYDLLMYRTTYQDIMRNKVQKDALNDLLISEFSINTSSGHTNNFETNKIHQLFQSAYLIGVNDFKAARYSLKELIQLFQDHPQQWIDNPYYYIITLENVLRTLRAMKHEQDMPYFIDILLSIQTKSKGLKALIASIATLYQIYPLVDNGLFIEANQIITTQQKKIENQKEHLSLNKQAELVLCWAISQFGLGEYKKVKELLGTIIFQSQHFYYLPIFRTIRLVHLMSLYKLNLLTEYDFEMRSFKRDLSKHKQSYQVETLILQFIQRPKTYFNKREEAWSKIAPQIEHIQKSIFEKQILYYFDFLVWMESEVKNIPLSNLLQKKKAQSVK